jgi:hypothetical protein
MYGTPKIRVLGRMNLTISLFRHLIHPEFIEDSSSGANLTGRTPRRSGVEQTPQARGKLDAYGQNLALRVTIPR